MGQKGSDVGGGELSVPRNRENADDTDAHAEQRQRGAQPMRADGLPRRRDAQQERVPRHALRSAAAGSRFAARRAGTAPKSIASTIEPTSTPTTAPTDGS